jgi:hypothetical protein
MALGTVIDELSVCVVAQPRRCCMVKHVRESNEPSSQFRRRFDWLFSCLLPCRFALYVTACSRNDNPLLTQIAKKTQRFSGRGCKECPPPFQ